MVGTGPVKSAVLLRICNGESSAPGLPPTLLKLKVSTASTGPVKAKRSVAVAGGLPPDRSMSKARVALPVRPPVKYTLLPTVKLTMFSVAPVRAMLPVTFDPLARL